MWYEHVAHHYSRVADRLIPLLTDKIITASDRLGRFQRAIYLLRRFAKIAPTRKVIQYGVVMPHIPDVNTHTPGLVQRITQEPVNQKKNIGRMVWKGLIGALLKHLAG